MPDVLENTLPLTAGGDVKPSTEFDVGECFAPFITQISVSPAPKAAPKPEPSVLTRTFDRIFRDMGWEIPALTDAAPETGISVPAAVVSAGDTHS